MHMKLVYLFFIKAKEPLLCIWSASILILCIFYFEGPFLKIEPDNDSENENDNRNKYDKKLELKGIYKCLDKMENVLSILDKKTELCEAIQRIIKSHVYLSDIQWMLLDSVNELSAQISSLQINCISYKMDKLMTQIIKCKGNIKRNAIQFALTKGLHGNIFTQNNTFAYYSEYYTLRYSMFLGKPFKNKIGYYIKNKFKEITLNSQTHFIFNDKNVWKQMTFIDKTLLIRLISNISTLKAVTFKDCLDFGNNGCLHLCKLFNNTNMIMDHNDVYIYKKYTDILFKNNIESIKEYIYNHKKLDKLINNINDDIDKDEEITNNILLSIQKYLKIFQNLIDWNTIITDTKTITNLHDKVYMDYRYNIYRIKRLYLSNCNITNIGISMLSNSLIDNFTLKILHLNNNKINDNGCKALGYLLSKNCALNEIDLSYNFISINGVINIIKGWHKNYKYSRLKELDLTQNIFKISHFNYHTFFTSFTTSIV